MARMFPNRLDPETESRAERILYRAFERDLPDGVAVFHSVAWQSREQHRAARDGEADFVIVHPDYGVLVLEAKSGMIDYDGRSGEWLQNDHTMRDPFEQAMRSMHLLKQVLESEAGWHSRNLVYAHGVAFTDVVAGDTDLLLKAPRDIIIDKRDVQDVDRSVRRLFQHYRQPGRIYDTLRRGDFDFLENMLAPVRRLRSLMAVDITEEAEQFVELSREQYQILDFLAWQPRAAIAGCAGSGKTMIAAEKARRLAGQGWRVLLTCYNRNLAGFLRDDYLAQRPDTLDVEHFHAIAFRLVQRYGIPVDVGKMDTAQRQLFFDEKLPELLIDAVEHMPEKYDAIVVDEGQDFADNWLYALQILLKDPDKGTYYTFFDDNQNIYGGSQRIAELGQAGYPLSKNFRNTQKIHAVVQTFYRGEHDIEPRGPEGRDVVIQTYDTENDHLTCLRKTLHRLINEQDVDPADIVILTPRSPDRSALGRVGRVGHFRFTNNWELNDFEVFYTSIHSFKGLESPVIILTELDADNRHLVDELLYVGCSRARHHLEVICHSSLADRFGG